jgi:hypothetical protein
MMRHFSAEVIGRLSEDDLDSRRAGRVRSHLARCARCSTVSRQLDSVTSLLASTTAPPMPESLNSRIQSSLATEAARRTATAPQSEAGRRDLPERRPGPRRKRPLWTSPAFVRATAATAVVAIAAGVGVAIASSHHGGGSAASSGPAVFPGHGAAAAAGPIAMNVGPQMSYRTGDGADRFRPVSSHVGYTSANLVSQVSRTLQQATGRESSGGPGVASSPSVAVPGAGAHPSTRQGAPVPALNSFGGILTSALEGCVGRVAGQRPVLLVDIDQFLGKPATVIVIGASGALGEQVWVVGPTCSATASDVILHRVIGG